MDKLISLQSVITMLENKRFEVEKDLSKAYLLADVQEQIEHLPAAFDKEKVIEDLEDYLFEKYCVEGDEKIAEIIEKGGAKYGRNQIKAVSDMWNRCIYPI